MKRKNLTRNALVTSILSLVLCVSMLVGTTFAWFTDSVTSAGNTIVSGTLQVDLLDANNASLEGKQLEFVQVDGNGDTSGSLTDPLWEPGATFVTEEFKIVNEGNLNLKYTIVVTGIDGDAKLNEVITWTITGNPDMAGTLAPGASAGLYRLSGHMAESATNEYQNLTMSGIGITVYATQATVENDSFSNEYDKDAEFDEITYVDSADALNTTLTSGGYAVVTENISSTTTAQGYGQADIKLNGGTLKGNGNTLSVDGEDDYSAIATTGGTIENLNIDKGFRAVFLENMTEDVYLTGMKIGGEGVCYAINTGSNNYEHSLIVNDCEINGWTSFAQLKSASFTNCKFGQGSYYTNVFGRLVKPYINTVFTNCEFSSKYYIDLSQLEEGQTIVLKNCTVNGTLLTADNWQSLIAPENTCGEGQISVELKDGTYMTAENVRDYVIIE